MWKTGSPKPTDPEYKKTVTEQADLYEVSSSNIKVVFSFQIIWVKI